MKLNWGLWTMVYFSDGKQKNMPVDGRAQSEDDNSIIRKILEECQKN